MVKIKKIAILGSTGSIGTQALEVIALHSDKFSVSALSANSNKDLLFDQVRKFKPSIAALCGHDDIGEIPDDLNFCKFICGNKALSYIATNVDYDYLLVSVVGMLGLKSVLEGLNAGKRILLANKEALVAGGKIVIKAAENAAQKARSDLDSIANACFADGIDFSSPLSRILPIDSEHSAIFQCMTSNSQNKINRIFLTCSGGPFRLWEKEKIYNASVKDALKHPQWNMGAKISIDSASLANKALEMVEAKYLFGLDEQYIEVLIHPQSIVHSMVGFEDRGIIAQLGVPSMKLPILYSMSYPERFNCGLDYPELHNLNFEKPDTDKFESLKLIRQCLRQDDASCAVYNAANEVAVDAFLKHLIPFGEIVLSIKHTLNKIESLSVNSFEEIIYADSKAREITKEYIRRK